MRWIAPILIGFALLVFAQQPINQSQLGGAAVYADPCLTNTPTWGTFSLTGNTKIITGTSAKKVYFCSWNDQNGGTAQNYAVVEGTGSTCGTSTAAFPGLSGGTTAAGGWNVAANGGRVIAEGGHAFAQEATNADDVCIFISGSTQLSGGFSYVVQ